MPCIDRHFRQARRAPASWAAVAAATAASLLLAACGSPPSPPPARPAPVVSQPGTTPSAGAAVGQAVAPKAGPVRLPAPSTPRTKLDLQRQLAERLVQAHPETSYLTRAPDRLLAIPVLEIELNGDGSVRRIEVLRHPKTGPEATKLAIEAVHRAAPYGSVTHLPRPWKVVETFLFDDSLRFKPRILDLP